VVATAERKKVRYHDKDTNKFAWAYPEDLPDYVREATETADPVAVADSKPRDYSDLIDTYLYQIREARETLRRSAGNKRAEDECTMKIDQFGAAIENAKAAEQITDEAANFVSLGGEFSFRLPPKVAGEYTTETRRSMSRCYLATDPLEIAWLRRMATGGHVQEVGLTKRVAVPRDGKPAKLVEATTWFEMLDMEVVNP
jgi:hypothetical protein